MKRATLWGLALVMVLGISGFNQPTWGQQTTASITGTVEDAAGAALNEEWQSHPNGRRWTPSNN